MRAQPWLLTERKTKEILQEQGFRFQKRYGQNFLLDAKVPERIVEAAGIDEESRVLEIGPGIGTLTQYLACYAKQVLAIEIDRNLFPILGKTLADWDNVEVVEGDVMKLDLPSLLAEKLAGGAIRVVANLPYYITTSILMKLLEENLPVESITVMVQKEVADRMCAVAGDPDYGAFSLAVRYYSEPEICVNVPPNCFIPRPKVGSAVIRLTVRPESQRLKVSDPGQMFRIIRAAFGQRRKMMRNALENSQDLSYTREEIRSAIAAGGFPETIRGEALNLEDFARLTDILEK